ncbi:hypothetical protein HK096_010045, partial [Nowakowskiella sp. JEL0078]
MQKFRKIKLNLLLQLEENYTNQLKQLQYYRHEIFEKAIDELTLLVHRNALSLRETSVTSPFADSNSWLDEKRSPGNSAYRDLELRISPALSPKISEKKLSISSLKLTREESILNFAPELNEEILNDHFHEIKPKQNEKTNRPASTSKESILKIDDSKTVTYQRLGRQDFSKNLTTTTALRPEIEKQKASDNIYSKNIKSTSFNLDEVKSTNSKIENASNFASLNSEEADINIQPQSLQLHSDIESYIEISESKKKDHEWIPDQQISNSSENFGNIHIIRKVEPSESLLSETQISASSWSEASNDFSKSSTFSSNRDVEFQPLKLKSSSKRGLYILQNGSEMSISSIQNSTEAISSTSSLTSSIPRFTKEHSYLAPEDAKFMEKVNQNIANRSILLKLEHANIKSRIKSDSIEYDSNRSAIHDSSQELKTNSKFNKTRHQRNHSASSMGSINSNQSVSTKDVYNQFNNLLDSNSINCWNRSPGPGQYSSKKGSPIPKIETRDVYSQL